MTKQPYSESLNLVLQLLPPHSSLNKASVLRLVTALLVEISEPRETGKIYLSMKSQNQPQT